ncbi:MAG: DUF4185 domain-containing protein [Candidatus Thiodiazotropha sp. (ex Dulcina madagascariensis)]|nr:DUF4185 domain-containing protein [Candidatus Thiodiazotropha sp. (ex Dulcina madagascariensis)]
MSATHRRIIHTAVLASFFIHGCSSDPDANMPAAEMKIIEATDLGPVATHPLIRGRDGGYSAMFEGYSVWLYGDTFLNQSDEHGQRLVGNTWSYTNELDAGDGIDSFNERLDSVGSPRQFFPLEPEELQFNIDHTIDNCIEQPCGARWALWPKVMVPDPDRERMLVFYEKVYAEPGSFNFSAVGCSLAQWTDFNGSPERYRFDIDQHYPTMMFSEDEPGFGSAATVVGADMYVYACRLEGYEKPCRLGRVALENAHRRSAWEYLSWNGGWSDNIKEAIALFNGNDIMSVSYNPYINRYIAIYNEPMDRAVMFRTAIAPEGPWSRAEKAFDAIPPDNDIGWVYDALHHPEYDQDGGQTIYVTYSRENGFLSSELRLVSLKIKHAATDDARP